ncbi:GH25 family lysozyme [Enterococcus mediterraneensis]|uniref:GH25 family lysozyme n=1 Tax=Enterococcus mediterraneensis TaxID=2364791 RepID=UPI000F057A67|nr:GH25 family lysozyme [Enterococcus mediterraneensis]
MSIPTPVILDISEWQPPASINYDKLAKAVDGVIIRIQYGSNYIDKHYKTHINEFKKRGVPIAVYAWVRGSSYSDMETEAKDFYNRAKAYNPTFWWLDVEEKSMSDMRGGVEKYRAKLKSLGAKKVGVYVANHLYASFNLDTAKFDGIWIPTYGSNNGQYNGSNPTATSNYDIHQYTSNGKLNGYNGPLDLNRIVRKGFDYFFGGANSSESNSGNSNSSSSGAKYSTSGKTIYKMAEDVKNGKAGNGDTRKKNLGNYYNGVQAVVNYHAGGSNKAAAMNVLAKETLAGKYGNGDARKKVLGNYYDEVQAIINKESAPAKTYTVKSGDTLSRIGTKLGVNWKTLASKNGIKGPAYTIYPGQKIKY